MNCFNHPERSAVGVCAACGRALCRDCAHETEAGLSCGKNCAPAKRTVGYGMRPGVRKRSEVTLLGWPFYDIALGPNPATGQLRGHARGIIAIGDTARGVLAIGGVAAGVVAIGGVAVGGLVLGGAACGLVAFGGAAVGVIAIGGGAVGYYAVGGGAAGKYVIHGAGIDPEAVEFFRQFLPTLGR